MDGTDSVVTPAQRRVISVFWVVYVAWLVTSLMLLGGTGYLALLLILALVTASVAAAVTFGLVRNSWRTARRDAVATTVCAVAALSGLMSLQLLARSRPGWPQSVTGFDVVFYLTAAAAVAWVLSLSRLMFGAVGHIE